MPTLLITGNRSGAGKTSLAAALLMLSAKAGRRAAYWKPFSSSPAADPDVGFASGVLADHLGIPPVAAPKLGPMPPLRSAALTELQNQSSELRAQCDVVIVEAGNLTLAGQLAGALDAKVLLAHPYVAGTYPPSWPRPPAASARGWPGWC